MTERTSYAGPDDEYWIVSDYVEKRSNEVARAAHYQRTRNYWAAEKRRARQHCITELGLVGWWEILMAAIQIARMVAWIMEQLRKR